MPLAALAAPTPAALAQTTTREPVILDQDGGAPDDFLSTALVASMPNVDLRGVIVTPADCFIEPAVRATRKLLGMMGRVEVPVAQSTARAVNPFPTAWRKMTYAFDALPQLASTKLAPLLAESGQQFLVRALREAGLPVTLLVTGPLTNVAEALAAAPEVESKIARIVWMGGALRVAGNVEQRDEPSHDGTAEWNVYWDPYAAARVWASKVKIIMCPLDLTNEVPVTREVIARLNRQRQFALSDLTATTYGVASAGNDGLFFWDILTTAYIGRPDLFETREDFVGIVTDGASQGRTVVKPNGRPVQVLTKVDRTKFYDYFLGQVRR